MWLWLMFRMFAGDQAAALQVIKLAGYMLEFFITQLC